MIMDFVNLSEAYEKAAWATSRIVRSDVTGQALEEAVRVHRLASAYIVRAEKATVSARGKIDETSIITEEQRRRGYANSAKSRQAPNLVMRRMYMQALADNGGKMSLPELRRAVDVSGLIEIPNRKNLYRRIKEAEAAGHVIYTVVHGGSDRGSLVEITAAGREWLEEKP